MARKRKTVSRRPVKVRGTLPAPKTSPARVRLVWYRRRVFQVLGAVILVAAVGLGVWQFMKARDRSRKAEDERRAIGQFERGLSVGEGPLGRVVQEMDTLPEQLKTGQLAAAEFNVKTESWLTELRKLDSELRKKRVPSRLDDARALLVQGVLIYIDAAKTFQLAGLMPDPSLRDRALEQGRNLIEHASAVYGTGRRALALQRIEVGLATDEQTETILREPVPLPPENARPAPAQSP